MKRDDNTSEDNPEKQTVFYAFRKHYQGMIFE